MWVAGSRRALHTAKGTALAWLAVCGGWGLLWSLPGDWAWVTLGPAGEEVRLGLVVGCRGLFCGGQAGRTCVRSLCRGLLCDSGGIPNPLRGMFGRRRWRRKKVSGRG